MMDRKEKRQKRLQLAYELTVLEEARKNGQKVTPKDIKEVGAKYLDIAKDVPGREIETPEPERTWKAKAEEAGLTPEIYAELKAKKVLDVDIMDDYNISKHEIVKWKKRVGIIPENRNFKKPRPKPKPKVDPALKTHKRYKGGEEIPAHILELADENNIKYKTFLNRIYNLGWSYEKAATKPAGKNGRNNFERRKAK